LNVLEERSSGVCLVREKNFFVCFLFFGVMFLFNDYFLAFWDAA
jgi:hypothetical protein